MTQHLYLTLVSQTVTAAEITARLGMEPDRVTVRGSKRMTPNALPRAHSWEVHCANTSQRIDDQVTAVLEPIAPVAADVRRMVDALGLVARLVCVRHFNDQDGAEENLGPTTMPDGLMLHAIAGQHQLLGWCLEPDQLALLAEMRASIDADEYG